MDTTFPAPVLPQVALVFGSGGARGWAHVGVLRAFRELGFRPGRVVGASIGSVAAAAHAAGALPALEHLAESMDWKQAASLFLEIGLPRSGLLEGRRILALLRELIPETHIEKLPIPCAAVATDLRNQTEVVIERGDLHEAIRASIAIPGIFTPVRHDGAWLVDGGLVNPLPVSVARKAGARSVIAVDINLRHGTPAADLAHRTVADARPPVLRTLDKLATLARWKQRIEAGEAGSPPEEKGLRPFLESLFGLQEPPRNASPTMLEVLTRSLRTGENAITRERLLREPPDLLIQPAVGHIGTLEFHRSAEAIRAGYAAAMEQTAAIAALRAPAGRGAGEDERDRVRRPSGGGPAPRSAADASHG